MRARCARSSRKALPRNRPPAEIRQRTGSNDMPTKAEQVVDAFFSAMENLEHDKVEKLYADNATIWHSFDDKTVSKDDIVNNVRNMKQFATLSFKIYDRLATDSTVAQRFDTIVHVPG